MPDQAHGKQRRQVVGPKWRFGPRVQRRPGGSGMSASTLHQALGICDSGSVIFVSAMRASRGAANAGDRSISSSLALVAVLHLLQGTQRGKHVADSGPWLAAGLHGLAELAVLGGDHLVRNDSDILASNTTPSLPVNLPVA